MQLTGSEIIIECLKEQGVDTVFGYPGGTILNVYDALYKHSDEIHHVLTSHEQGASHAADGYARATGKVGVCMATSGPGATNLVTGIATAFMDSVPVSLEEAAWIDGCSRFQGVFKVILPLMLPGVCTVGIYTFSGCWGNFFVPFILLSASEKYPASVMLYQFFSQHSVAYGELAAYSVIYTLPSIILYVITQKWMSKGFSLSGADKG